MDYKLSIAPLIIIMTVLIVGVSATSSIISVRGIQTQNGTYLLGDWSGESICQVRDSPCNDERVIYHISAGSDANHVTVSADKIVNGKTINMGTGEFKYDAQAGTLISDFHGHWEFTIKGKKMEGTLKLPDKTLLRRVTLTKRED
jgi:hypothetical protein